MLDSKTGIFGRFLGGRLTYPYCSITLAPHMGGLMPAKPPVSSSPKPPMSQRGVNPRFLKSQPLKGAADTLYVYCVSSQSGRHCFKVKGC